MNITILDVNDNAPSWSDEPYHANVVEMSPMDTDVMSVRPAPRASELHHSSQI